MTAIGPAYYDRPPERYLDAQGGTHDDAAIPHYLLSRYPTYMGIVAIANAVTGATAGTPGAFTPAGAAIPGSLADLQSLGALGETTAWTEGQNVVLGDGSLAHWDGTAWDVGAAPA